MEASGSDTTEREALEGGDAPDTDERRTVWLDTSEGPAVAEGDTYEREATERDTTAEWRIEPGSAPATVAELEERIDVALVTAEAAEEAAMEIGAASLEAAEQARRAAELAERASAAAARAAGDASTAAESAARAEAASATAAETATRSAAAATATAAPPAAAATATAATSGTATNAEPGADVDPAVNGPAPTESFLPRPESPDPRRPDPFEERITAFRLRAERVMIRLQKLEAGADPGDGPTEVVRLRR